jgi:hypothetical protein
VADRLMVVPASLREGALIIGPNALEDRRRVDFVTLHELGHLAAKRYLHPESGHEELPVLGSRSWSPPISATRSFPRLITTGQSLREKIGSLVLHARGRSNGAFMRPFLRPNSPPRTAGTKLFLKLRVADIYGKHRLTSLRDLKAKLPFDRMSTWTTESVLEDLERIAPGFQRWADEFQKGQQGAWLIRRSRG